MGIGMEKLLIGIIAYYNVVIRSTDFIEGILKYHKFAQTTVRR
jgi:hypothetical protein